MHKKRFNRELKYLRDPERLERLEVNRVVELSLDGLPGVKSVLDIGMGTGVFAEAFGARGLSVSGVDVNPEMLPAALTFVPTATFKEGAAEALPFPDEAFDLAFMGLLLHESDDSLAAIKEAFRVCKKRLVVLEWPYEEPTVENPVGPPLEHRLKAESIAGLASLAGFKHIETIHLQNLMLFRLDKI